MLCTQRPERWSNRNWQWTLPNHRTAWAQVERQNKKILEEHRLRTWDRPRAMIHFNRSRVVARMTSTKVDLLTSVLGRMTWTKTNLREMLSLPTTMYPVDSIKRVPMSIASLITSKTREPITCKTLVGGSLLLGSPSNPGKRVRSLTGTRGKTPRVQIRNKGFQEPRNKPSSLTMVLPIARSIGSSTRISTRIPRITPITSKTLSDSLKITLGAKKCLSLMNPEAHRKMSRLSWGAPTTSHLSSPIEDRVQTKKAGTRSWITLRNLTQTLSSPSPRCCRRKDLMRWSETRI